MVCMTACVYMACMLLSTYCQDDYFLYSVILPVHRIHCLNSCNSTLFDIDLVFRMSHGTRGQLGRNQGSLLIGGRNRKRRIYKIYLYFSEFFCVEKEAPTIFIYRGKRVAYACNVVLNL